MPSGEPMSPTRTITDEELLQLPKDGNKYEVVGGELVVSPGAGFRHENIVGDGNRRGPDVSFIATDRLAAVAPDTVFPRLAPDLAVEVLSPSDSLPRMMAKVAEYLESGTRLVWVIDPENRRAAACRSVTAVREIGPDDDLDGEDVLPGFRCRLSNLLD